MIATKIKNTMKMPPPIATRSRRSRIHAICPSERPSMAFRPTPEGAASGAVSAVSAEASSAALCLSRLIMSA